MNALESPSMPINGYQNSNAQMSSLEASDSTPKKPLEEAKKNCEEVAHIQPGSINEMGAKLQQMILNYYQDVRKQAQQSFYCAMGAAIVGTILWSCAAFIDIRSESTSNYSRLGYISGSLIQVISAINFYLYNKTARQFSAFHICLERTNRFLLANTLCENITCTIKKDNIRGSIIKSVLDAPMLTLDIIENRRVKTGLAKEVQQTSENNQV
ncbi:TRADD-N-associated membrane domain-containing protein [Telluribacter sp. SYSU D00476]|uniref:TRADD-N-associated membrane domain-containing protein n=1 Tax=Telluribacter sp. SYSU D00476 TaxID=2811430 RepID=UPI001FF61A07|nr:hypothetical protein [Telluribacter sp. SYSU D00476]